MRLWVNRKRPIEPGSSETRPAWTAWSISGSAPAAAPRRAPSTSVVSLNSRPITAAVSSACTAGAPSGWNRRRTVSLTVSGSGKSTWPGPTTTEPSAASADTSRSTSVVKNGFPSVVCMRMSTRCCGHRCPVRSSTIRASSSSPKPRRVIEWHSRPSAPTSRSTSEAAMSGRFLEGRQHQDRGVRHPVRERTRASAVTPGRPHGCRRARSRAARPPRRRAGTSRPHRTARTAPSRKSAAGSGCPPKGRRAPGAPARASAAAIRIRPPASRGRASPTSVRRSCVHGQ